MAGRLARREFLAWLAAGALFRPAPFRAADEFPVPFRRPAECEDLVPLIDPRNDVYELEKQAAAVEPKLREMMTARSLPLAGDFRGFSPLPSAYRDEAGVKTAEFQPGGDFAAGLKEWLDSLGEVRRADFYVLPEERVRYEVASVSGGEMVYRVGFWRMGWREGRLAEFEPLRETVARSPAPLFRDVTGELFRDVSSFHDQLAKGVPYWRSRLDSASGVGVYGNQGVAAGDIDGDGWDEIYVCQPGGLPNRLYKRRDDGRWEDRTGQAGVGLLDDTAQALFIDLRNSGAQDLAVLTSSRPLLFLNDGEGRFRAVPDAFRFRTPPQGTFAGMAAADYDGDGRVDLYLCSYLYFQSEDQYRYPVPYHDARNGPPNFLFRNRLTTEGEGFFEDVTAEAGFGENNGRYSFAAAWCDYDEDGRPELYVANDFGRNNLYKYVDGRFRDVAEEKGVEDVGPGMSAAWFDYDGDGRLDLYVTNMWTASGQRVASGPSFGPVQDGAAPAAYYGHMKGNSLYRNEGGGRFSYKGGDEGVEMGRWSWAGHGFDFDLDGTPEIFVTAGMITHDPAKDLGSFFWRQVVANSPADDTPAPAYETGWNCLNELIREDYSWNGNEPNVFYVRRGGRYFDFSGVSGLDRAADSRAFAVTDFDGDGRPDLFLKNRLGPQLIALRNESAGERKFIVLELEGTRSNRDAIGAIVRVESANGRSAQVLSAGSGYISQHTKRLYFGLDEAERAETVTVLWPSGARQVFRGLAAGFRYRLVEGAAEYERFPLQPRQPPPAAAPAEGSNDLVFEPAWLIEPVPLPEERPRAGFLYLTDGDPPVAPAGVPFETIDLRKAPEEQAAAYAIFRRYLFDYRAPLRPPLLLLADERSRVHKVYPAVPPAEELKRDLEQINSPERLRLALPFEGWYDAPPSRNHFRMGSAFLQAGYVDKALPYLQEVLGRQPDNFKAHLAVGQVHLQQGRLAEARRHLEKAASLDTESPELWNNLGGLEMEQGNHQAALERFEKALALNPAAPYALVNAAQAYKRVGNTAEAEKLLRRALELDPDDADTANRLGLLLAKKGELEEAEELFQQAIALQRDYAEAINNLAVLYIQQRKVQDAIAAFRYGIEKAPDFDMFYMNLARLYYDLGERVMAEEALRDLLKRKPDHEAAREALRRLETR